MNRSRKFPFIMNAALIAATMNAAYSQVTKTTILTPLGKPRLVPENTRSVPDLAVCCKRASACPPIAQVPTHLARRIGHGTTPWTPKIVRSTSMPTWGKDGPLAAGVPSVLRDAFFL